MDIQRINLWGGPGSGKSLCASQVFAKLKVVGYSIEYIQEYVKMWAYEKREMGSFDQVYIFAKQQRLEDRVLRAGVNLIVTDSPLLMQCVYAKKYNFAGWQQLLDIGKLFDNQYPAINFLLNRTHMTYQDEGRWQTHAEAIALDSEIKSFMDEYLIPYVQVDNRADVIVEKVCGL